MNDLNQKIYLYTVFVMSKGGGGPPVGMNYSPHYQAAGYFSREEAIQMNGVKNYPTEFAHAYLVEYHTTLGDMAKILNKDTSDKELSEISKRMWIVQSVEDLDNES